MENSIPTNKSMDKNKKDSTWVYDLLASILLIVFVLSLIRALWPFIGTATPFSMAQAMQSMFAPGVFLAANLATRLAKPGNLGELIDHLQKISEQASGLPMVLGIVVLLALIAYIYTAKDGWLEVLKIVIGAFVGSLAQKQIKN